MRRLALLAAVSVSVTAAPVIAAPRFGFDIPAQRLDSALIALGNQAQISIGGIDARIASARSNTIRGRMPVRRALVIMLRNTGFTFQQIDASTFHILRAPPKPSTPELVPKPLMAKAKPKPAPKPQRVPTKPLPPPSALPEVNPAEIIVTATKQDQNLEDYPGTAHVVDVGSVGLSENRGAAAFVARIPSLASTNLGPGRNKLFVRGIADSSFTGPTQSTVGLYLGDLRLTYNAPDPDLRLHDIDHIEVIEGPQGTLYGAGALGGVIRIMPNMANTNRFNTSANVGYSATKGSQPGYDLSGMINVPLIHDRVALRLVGYHQIEGGYISNASLGTRNTNRSRIIGGRANLRIRREDGWMIDLNAVNQNIDTRDGQYAERGLPARTHAARFAQPHDNDFTALNLEVAKDWNHTKLVSSTGIVGHNLSDVFDATGYLGQPETLVYESDDKIRLITHETRLSDRGSEGRSWVAGVSFVRNSERMERKLGAVRALVMLAALRNAKTEIALFGEATRPIAPRLSATLGARLVYAATIGELLGGSGPKFEPKRSQVRLLPTAALSWKPREDVIAFLRYQSGFRSGGIAVSGGQINSAREFDADSIHTAELGVRFGGGVEQSSMRLSGGVTSFYSIWNDIQADLISPNGLAFTDNIGRGAVYGIEANGRWRATDNLTFDGAVFLNHSALTSPSSGFAEADERSLPNIAKTGGRISAAWRMRLNDEFTLKLDGTLHLVGASSLGTTTPLILEQGETEQADLSAAIDSGTWSLTLDAINIFNAGGNSFSYGNPFSVGQGRQITPLRPRTVRLGARIAL